MGLRLDREELAGAWCSRLDRARASIGEAGPPARRGPTPPGLVSSLDAGCQLPNSTGSAAPRSCDPEGSRSRSAVLSGPEGGTISLANTALVPQRLLKILRAASIRLPADWRHLVPCSAAHGSAARQTSRTMVRHVVSGDGVESEDDGTATSASFRVDPCVSHKAKKGSGGSLENRLFAHQPVVQKDSRPQDVSRLGRDHTGRGAQPAMPILLI